MDAIPTSTLAALLLAAISTSLAILAWLRGHGRGAASAPPEGGTRSAVAKEIVERTRDGIIVVDQGGLVLQLNPAAARLLRVDARTVLGRPAAAVFSAFADVLSAPALREVEREVTLEFGTTEFVYDVRVSALAEARRLIVVRDVNQAKRSAALETRDDALANRGKAALAETAAPASARVLAESATARPKLKGDAALVLDERIATRRSVETHLKNWGAAVDAAEGVAQALAILRSAARRRHPFSWLFVDAPTVAEDLARLLHSVRAETSLRQTRIVLLTEEAQRQIAEDLLRQQLADAVLSKPLREPSLRECVTSLLAGREEPPPDRNGRSPGAATATDAARARPRTALPSTPTATPTTRNAVSRDDAASGTSRVLVVEDNAVNQRVAVRLLANFGHAADVVVNGKEAVAAIQGGRYDLVLMDCHMPVMDGFQATEEIRRRETAGAHLAIVAMTMDGDRERCLATGMDDYITKPVRPADLAAVLSKWLPGSGPEARVA